MQVQLRVENGGQAGKLIAITKDKFLIGRSDECHLRPKSESVSRRHCAIVKKEGRVLLIDLKSRNGTIVNDKKLDPSRAKVLKDGDKIKVGKLAFTAVLETGIANTKKPVVKDVKDAADRTASNTGDSRYEEVDVSSWLEEADQFERREGDPITRQFQIEASDEASSDSTALEIKAEEETKTDKPREKKPPGKLPPQSKKASTGNSKDAATETLRKFFSGR
jgi:pSer/pThr/pTyr-binding forkhead associated (FHA) protein